MAGGPGAPGAGPIKVTVVTPYFPPERGAPQQRWGELVELLAGDGFDVEVLTNFPHYPSGSTYPGYRWAPLKREEHHGASVWRFGNVHAATAGFWPRLVDQLSSGLVLAFAVMIRPRSEWVICETPPVFGALALAVARLRGSQCALYVADLWPESAVDIGTISPGGAVERVMRRLMHGAYRRASLVFTTSEAQRERCQAVTSTPCHSLPSSVDLRRFPHPRARPASREPAPLRIAYTGTLGLAHGLDFLVDAASAFPPEVELDLVGDGAERARLVSLAGRDGARVRVLPPIEPEEVPVFLGGVDVGIVALRDGPTFRGVLPSKVFEYFAAALPVLVIGGGEVADLVLGAGAGVVVPPGDRPAMVEAVGTLAAMPRAEREAMGRRGRALVETSYSRAGVARRMAGLLRSVGT